MSEANLRLTTRPVQPHALTVRQQDVLTLVENYYAVAHEMPSFGWIARRMGFSRQRARHIRDSLRSRGQWLDR